MHNLVLQTDGCLADFIALHISALSCTLITYIAFSSTDGCNHINLPPIGNTHALVFIHGSISRIGQVVLVPAPVSQPKTTHPSGITGASAFVLYAVEPDQKEIVSYGVGAVFAAGAVYGAIQAKKKRDAGAVIDLYNAIVDLPDPNDLTQDIVLQVCMSYNAWL